MNKICGQCEYTDGLTYTSLPSKVKCTITGEYHFQNDICNIEFKPTIKAKWIIKPDFMMDVSNQCSACGKEFILLDGTSAIGDYHFCPNCGATMTNTD